MIGLLLALQACGPPTCGAASDGGSVTACEYRIGGEVDETYCPGESWVTLDGCTRCTCDAGGTSSCLVREPVSARCADQVVGSVAVVPSTIGLTSLGEEAPLVSEVRGHDGALISDVDVQWSASPPDVVALVADGPTLVAVGNGEGLVSVEAGRASAAAEVLVEQIPTSFEIVGVPARTIELRAPVPLSAVPLDAGGTQIAMHLSVSWSTSDPAVATVDNSGSFMGIGAGEVTVFARGGGLTGQAVALVDQWRDVAASDRFSCGMLASGRSFCWGWLPGTRAFTTAPDAALRDPDDHELRLVQLAVGRHHACGLDDSGAAWCWGTNTWGQLGDGTYDDRVAPARVSGGHHFVDVAVGHPTGSAGAHTCGLTSSGTALCWGDGTSGQLGIGPTSGLDSCNNGAHRCGTLPLSVSEGQYDAIDVASGTTCARQRLSGSLWCWGDDVVAPTRLGPAPSGPLSAQSLHWCGIELPSTAVCWGFSAHGALGTGTPLEAGPTPVAGSRQWAWVSAGTAHTCGITVLGVPFCWGRAGPALGLDTTKDADVPEPREVSGEHRFSTLTVSGQSCGVTMTGLAMCWGQNFVGQLGDGTIEDRSAPVRVLDPPPE